MIYKLKNVAGEARTIAGVEVADQEFLVFVDETNISANIVGAIMGDASTITQMFVAEEIEYYEGDSLRTEVEYWWEINGMQPLGSLKENKWEILARGLTAQPDTITGDEKLQVEGNSNGWKEQTYRIQLGGDRSTAPTVVFVGDVNYVNANGLEVNLIDREWFEVTYNVKGDGLTCTVEFTWEATYV